MAKWLIKTLSRGRWKKHFVIGLLNVQIKMVLIIDVLKNALFTISLKA